MKHVERLVVSAIQMLVTAVLTSFSIRWIAQARRKLRKWRSAA